MIFLAQIPGVPLDLLVDLAKIGEFGSAIAMLILGFYLHWQASKAPLSQIEPRKAVAKQFMVFAGAFFLVCCAVELAKLELPERHPTIHAGVEVPPLDASDYDEFGEIDIVRFDSDDQQKDTKQASSSPQYFSIHENSMIVVNLNSLVKKFNDMKTTKQVVENNLVTETKDLGPGDPK